MLKVSVKNITVNGKRTSIRLENLMWDSFHEIAAREKLTIHQLATEISNRTSDDTSLTASIRLFIMLYFKAAATNRGHALAGHGTLKKRLNRLPTYKQKADYSVNNISKHIN